MKLCFTSGSQTFELRDGFKGSTSVKFRFQRQDEAESRVSAITVTLCKRCWESPFVVLCTVKLRNQSTWLEVNVADLRHTMATHFGFHQK
jgi:hypothetical protein